MLESQEILLDAAGEDCGNHPGHISLRFQTEDDSGRA
jgi:hypothetical protein